MKYSTVIFFTIIAIIFTQSNTSNAAKILGFFAAPGRSHLIVHTSLTNALANRGHEVTTVTLIEPPGKIPINVRNILIPIDMEHIQASMKTMMKNAENEGTDWSMMLGFVTNMTDVYEQMITHPEFLKIKNEQFDLVIFGWFFNDFHIGVAAHFNAPAIISVSGKPSGMFRKFIGNPSGISYNPSAVLNYSGVMTFKQRLINFLAVSAEYLFTNLIDYFWYEPHYNKHFPADKYPSYDEAKRNVSLVFVNHHFSQGSMEAYLPGMVEVGGMQIPTKPNPLPKDIQEWLDGATDGAIFFSLGSNAKSSLISPIKRDAILRSLSKLKQRVLWKWEDDQLPNKPNNVMISKWFPQSDILAHPNTKLFISHCGFGSVTESKYHGIPILGMPIYGDQPGNLDAIINEGWAVACPLSELNETRFTAELNEILNNPKYYNEVKRISNLYLDRPQHALDTAVYWTEYVIRHNGAKHMQSPAVYLNFFQYHSLDVIGFIALIIYLVCKIVKISICYVYRKCCRVKRLKID